MATQGKQSVAKLLSDAAGANAMQMLEVRGGGGRSHPALPPRGGGQSRAAPLPAAVRGGEPVLRCGRPGRGKHGASAASCPRRPLPCARALTSLRPPPPPPPALPTEQEPDEHGATPFYSACMHGHLNIVRFLHEKGVDCRRGTAEQTPWDAAVKVCADASDQESFLGQCPPLPPHPCACPLKPPLVRGLARRAQAGHQKVVDFLNDPKIHAEVRRPNRSQNRLLGHPALSPLRLPA